MTSAAHSPQPPAFGGPVAQAPHLFGAPAPPSDLLPWRWAESRLAAARNYWVATAGPNGAPHTRPVWGIWTPAGLLFSTGSPVALRNLAANPAVAVHLGDGDDVVILEGTAKRVLDRPTLRRYADGLQDEYAYAAEATTSGFAGADGETGWVFLATPKVVFGWGADLSDPTRWAWPS